MKTIILPLLSLLIICSVSSCENQNRESNPFASNSVEKATADTSSAAFQGDEFAAAPLSSPSRKIIKTADLRCRVKDVFQATTHIERLVADNGGQIADSKMENTSDETRNLPYKSDSLRQVESYTTTAHLTLRVPVTRLDSVLSNIASQSAFVQSRSLHLDDVTIRYLGNKLKNDAMAENDAALKARSLARKTKDAVYSGEYTDSRNETRIDRKLDNMQLNEQVTYATLTIDLFQPQRITEMVIPNIEYLMKPSMGQQASLALGNGWQLLKSLLIGVLQIWPLILLLLAGIIGYRRFSGKSVRKTFMKQA